jgi:hypothetical protein
MKTREILSTLLEVSKSLEDQSYVREADKVHNLMVRVAQIQAPVKPKAYTPNNPLKNLGDALSGGAKAIGKGIGNLAKNVVKTYNNSWEAFDKSRPNPIELPHLKAERDLKRIALENQEKYVVDEFIARHVNNAANKLKSNKNYSVPQARIEMKSEAMRDGDYTLANELSKKIYKYDIISTIATQFDLYVVPNYQNRLDYQYGFGAYFGQDGQIVKGTPNDESMQRYLKSKL